MLREISSGTVIRACFTAIVSANRVKTRPPADYPGCPDTVTEAIRAGAVLRTPRWGLPDVVIMVVGAVAIAAALGWILTVLDVPFVLALLIGVVGPWLALAGWPMLATRVRGNGPVIDLGLRLTWSDAAWGLVAGIAALVVAAIAAILTSLVAGDFTSAAAEVAETLVAQGSPATWLAFGVLLAVGAPLVEEIAFRGLLFSAIRKRGFGPAIAIGVSALAFALAHAEPVRLPVLMVIGVILGFVRLRTGAIGACIVAHGVNNLPGAVFVVLGLPGMTP